MKSNYKKRIGIRTDGNEIIGTGHVRRCQSIADTLLLRDFDCIFFVSDQRSAKLIDNKKFKIITLDSEYNNLFGECKRLKAEIVENQIELLILDTYFLTENYLKGLSVYTKLAYIDDMGKPVFPYDMLINYSIYADKFDYYKTHDEKTLFLLGCEYTPLRNDFRNIGKKTICEKVENILVTSGGNDIYGIINKIKREVEKNNILIDADFFYADGKAKNMSDLMQKADIAISAAGTTLYELCACGTPMVYFSLADNQFNNAKGFSSIGAGIYTGDIRENTEIKVSETLEHVIKLMNNKTKREEISIKMQSIVDAEGTERIADKIIDLLENKD